MLKRSNYTELFTKPVDFPKFCKTRLHMNGYLGKY